MIGYIEGKLIKKEEDRILLLANQVGYEILLPAMVMESIRGENIGDEIALYIYFQQTERQPKPVLIGFNTEEEKDFFQLFISVEDIGPLKAVKALNISISEIANAIESKDAAKLTSLKGIGSRTAKKIIATLQGRMEKFALPDAAESFPVGYSEDVIKQVMEVLVSRLGHKTADARRMISEAVKRRGPVISAEELFDEIYRSGVTE
ncbi:MAG TPA: Holliday junction DNA helicase RuvA [Deltaproteobacteria bacterium]|nr:Holliday junction DNA helicase RuvA [Deltaproteobacteria bacterium]